MDTLETNTQWILGDPNKVHISFHCGTGWSSLHSKVPFTFHSGHEVIHQVILSLYKVQVSLNGGPDPQGMILSQYTSMLVYTVELSDAIMFLFKSPNRLTGLPSPNTPKTCPHNF